MALGFNRGEGIPILCLFQLSREGYRAADKNGGKYNLTHLSYANEAERSADVVMTSWFGEEMQNNNQTRYQCLKSRDQKPFDTFDAQISWPVGRILDMPIGFNGNKTYTPPKKDVLDEMLDQELS